MPLEFFLCDPPLLMPQGLDIINKTQIWQRPGSPSDAPIYDLLIWVGAEHYPYVSDFIEEVRRFGASRRISENLQLSMLSHESKMILAHPRCRNVLWNEQRAPSECGRNITTHVSYPLEERSGPCLFKAYELVPIEASFDGHLIQSDGGPFAIRMIGDTTYTYHPTGESPDGLAPGIFARLPLTGLTMITDGDGTLTAGQERAKNRLVETTLPVYESNT
jgi:hypothetical protein